MVLVQMRHQEREENRAYKQMKCHVTLQKQKPEAGPPLLTPLQAPVPTGDQVCPQQPVVQVHMAPCLTRAASEQLLTRPAAQQHHLTLLHIFKQLAYLAEALKCTHAEHDSLQIVTI